METHIISSSAVKNTDMCKETVQNPFLEHLMLVYQHTYTHTHLVDGIILHTQTDVGFQGSTGKQVALKCYEIFRWHTRSNIYSIYI